MAGSPACWLTTWASQILSSRVRGVMNRLPPVEYPPGYAPLFSIGLDACGEYASWAGAVGRCAPGRVLRQLIAHRLGVDVLQAGGDGSRPAVADGKIIHAGDGFDLDAGAGKEHLVRD